MTRLWKILRYHPLSVALIPLIVPLLVPVELLTGTVPERELTGPDSHFAEVNWVDGSLQRKGAG